MSLDNVPTDRPAHAKGGTGISADEHRTLHKSHPPAGVGRGTLEGPPIGVLTVVRRADAAHVECPSCGARLELSTVGTRWDARTPSKVADRLVVQMGGLTREELFVLVLDTKCRVIREVRLYLGNVSASVVRVGELFGEAVAQNGSGILIVHNHPSGDLTPSPDDLRLTAEAIAAGRLLDIAVLDHLIVGGDRYLSLRERGVIFDQPGQSRRA